MSDYSPEILAQAEVFNRHHKARLIAEQEAMARSLSAGGALDLLATMIGNSKGQENGWMVPGLRAEARQLAESLRP